MSVLTRSVVLFDDLENPTWATIEAMRGILTAKYGSQAEDSRDVVEVLQQLAAHLRGRVLLELDSEVEG